MNPRPDPAPLLKALYDAYCADPKLAMEIITGSCHWDDAIRAGEISDLAVSAADLAYDLEQARAMGLTLSGGKPITQHRIDCLRAAEWAFCDLAHDRRIAEDAEHEAYMERGSLSLAHGWQGVFL